MGYMSAITQKHSNFGAVVVSPFYGRSIQNWMAGHLTTSEISRADIFYHLTGLDRPVAGYRNEDNIIRSPKKAGITTLEAVEKACEGQQNGSLPSEGATEDS